MAYVRKIDEDGTANGTLDRGEIGLDKATGKMYVGDGVAAGKDDSLVVNAKKADQLADTKNIALTGDVTGTVDTDLSESTSIDTTVVAASTEVAGKVQLADNLTDTSTDKALTAAQGKALNDARAVLGKSNFVSSGVINKQDDALIFNEAVGNEYKMTCADRFVNFDGKVVDTYGPELVVDVDGNYIGDFSDGATVYGVYNGVVTITNGIGRITATSTVNGAFGFYRITGLTIGKKYKVKFTYVDSSSNLAYFRITMAAGSPWTNVLSVAYSNNYGDKEEYFIATQSTHYAAFGTTTVNVGQWAEFDNISVREITTIDMTDNMPEVTVQATNGLVVQSAVNAGDYVVVDKELNEWNHFDADADGWLAQTSTETITWDASGYITINRNGGSSQTSKKYFNLTAGTTYTIRYNVISLSNFTQVYVNLASGTIASPTKSTVGLFEYTFTSDETGSVEINIGATGNTSAVVSIDDFYITSTTSDIYRATEDIPALTSLTDARFEDRTQYGIANKILATMRNDGTIKTEVCFVDTDIEHCGNAHIVMTDNGYSKLSNGLYSKNGDVVTPIGTWTV
jgi:hypothetical protein